MLGEKERVVGVVAPNNMEKQTPERNVSFVSETPMNQLRPSQMQLPMDTPTAGTKDNIKNATQILEQPTLQKAIFHTISTYGKAVYLKVNID